MWYLGQKPQPSRLGSNYTTFNVIQTLLFFIFFLFLKKCVRNYLVSMRPSFHVKNRETHGETVRLDRQMFPILHSGLRYFRRLRIANLTFGNFLSLFCPLSFLKNCVNLCCFDFPFSFTASIFPRICNSLSKLVFHVAQLP